MKRQKTSYPGVTFYITEDGEKNYYIRYRQGGRGTKETEEPVGSSAKGMTPARANQIRSERIAGKALTNVESRSRILKKESEWTLKKIFEKYMDTLLQNKSRGTDRSLFAKWLITVHDKKPAAITQLDIENIQKVLLKENKSNQTIKHVLNLVTRCMNYATKSGLLQKDELITFFIKKPTVDANKTESMDDELLKKYLAALNDEEDQDRAAVLKIALFSGIRKSAILALRWKHIDFHRGILELEGKSAKNNKTAFIPINQSLMNVLKGLKQGAGEDLLFPNPTTGELQKDFRRMAKRVKAKAGLPDDFRPMHGLRHTYASRLASSGKVDLYTLQKLLTHESPEMTQRYAHLSNEAMQRAAAVADDVMGIKKD